MVHQWIEHDKQGRAVKPGWTAVSYSLQQYASVCISPLPTLWCMWEGLESKRTGMPAAWNLGTSEPSLLAQSLSDIMRTCDRR